MKTGFHSEVEETTTATATTAWNYNYNTSYSSSNRFSRKSRTVVMTIQLEFNGKVKKRERQER